MQLNFAFVSLAQQKISETQDSVCNNICSTHFDFSPAGVVTSCVHAKNEWMFLYRYMGMFMDEVVQGKNTIDETQLFSNYLWSPSRMRMQMHMLMAMYGISNRLAIMCMTDYLIADMSMKAFTQNGNAHHHGSSGNENEHKMKSNGISDVKLQLLYEIMRHTKSDILVMGGISIPTGSINKQGEVNDMMYQSKRMPYMMQMGSGSWDLSSGISYTVNFLKYVLSFQSIATFRIGMNKFDYKLGNEMYSTLWIARKWNSIISQSIRFKYNWSAPIEGRDISLYTFNEPSANPINYGGSNLQLLGGLMFQLKGVLNNNRLGFEAGLPIYQYVNGIQLKNKFNYTLNWNIRI
jgi:hypothetical protein